MRADLDSIITELEAKTKYAPSGIEYWQGRDLQKILGYTTWEKFNHVIDKAIMACESTGVDPTNHFHQLVKLVEAGSGTKVQRKDYLLTRYACYLIAMNGASNKPEIGIAQSYFAVQTRKQELQNQLTEQERRIYLRERVKNANRKLASAAKRAGVKRFPVFQDAGYRGLYEMSLAEIKKMKGLSRKDDLLDRAGRTELAANEFRITQTEDKIIRENIRGEEHAIQAHLHVGQTVRDTIKKLGGKMPENLLPEPSIKKLTRDRKKPSKTN